MKTGTRRAMWAAARAAVSVLLSFAIAGLMMFGFISMRRMGITSPNDRMIPAACFLLAGAIVGGRLARDFGGTK